MAFLRTAGCCLTLFVVLMIILFLGPLYSPPELYSPSELIEDNNGGLPDSVSQFTHEDSDVDDDDYNFDVFEGQREPQSSSEKDSGADEQTVSSEPSTEELAAQEELRLGRAKHHTEHSALLALPEELWTLVREKLDIVSIEILAKVSRDLRHERTSLEKSGLLLSKTDRQEINDLLLLGGFGTLVSAESSKQLACSSCLELHLIQLFAHGEPAKSARERMCIGNTGMMRYCVHKDLSYADLIEGLSQRDGFGSGMSFCQKCRPRGAHPPYCMTTAVKVSNYSPFRQRKHGGGDRDMIVQEIEIPCIARDYAGKREDATTNAYTYLKLKEVLETNTTPICNHIRLCDVMGSIKKAAFRMYAQFHCTEESCIMEMSFKSGFRGGTDSVELSVTRFLGHLDDPASPAWLAAMLRDEETPFDDAFLAQYALDPKRMVTTLNKDEHVSLDDDSDEDINNPLRLEHMSSSMIPEYDLKNGNSKVDDETDKDIGIGFALPDDHDDPRVPLFG